MKASKLGKCRITKRTLLMNSYWHVLLVILGISLGLSGKVKIDIADLLVEIVLV